MPFVQAGEVRLHYIEHGSGPEPLMFIHGYTGSCQNWSETLPRLPGRYRAYALDLRGAGESEKPASGYGPGVYAEDIHAATRELGLDTFTLIGHSMGGLTGMQLAVSHPERLRRLVLVAPAPSGGLTMDPAWRTYAKSIRSNREVRRQLARTFQVRPLSDAHIESFIDEDLKWPEAAYDEAWQAMVDIRLADAIARIQVPTLMVVGDRDALRAANLADGQRIPNCALHVFYRVGHMIQYDVADEFVALIDDFMQHGVAPPLTFDRRAEVIRELTATS